METLNDLAYSLWNSINPRLTDDENLDLRDFKDWIIDQRALFLRNHFNKRHTIDQSLIQSLGCVELEPAGTSECPDIQGCYFLRTKCELPTAIQMHNRAAIERVGPVDITQKAFPILEDFMYLNVAGSGRFNKKQIYAFVMNNRVYLKLLNNVVWQSALKFINIRMVLEDPREASKFTECGGAPCYNDATSPFPSNRWFKAYLEGAIVQYKIPTAVGATVDPLNDGEDIQTLRGGVKTPRPKSQQNE